MEDGTGGEFAFLQQQRYRPSDPRDGIDGNARTRRWRSAKGHEEVEGAASRRTSKPLDYVQSWAILWSLDGTHNFRNFVGSVYKISFNLNLIPSIIFLEKRTLHVFVISGVFHKKREDWRIVTRLYRGPFLIVEFLFLWGINIYGWRSSGVNHVLIFEMDPRNHLSEQHIIEIGAVFGVIWCISVLSFLYSDQLSIPAYINPLVLMAVMLLFVLNPTKTFRHEARFWALRVMVCILLSDTSQLFHIPLSKYSLK